MELVSKLAGQLRELQKTQTFLALYGPPVNRRSVCNIGAFSLHSTEIRTTKPEKDSVPNGGESRNLYNPATTADGFGLRAEIAIR
jgi:hypothetical protein